MFEFKSEITEGVFLEDRIDFTILDPRATESDLEKVCDIAYKRSYYSVCVNPANVSYVKSYIDKHFNGGLNVVSVVGFPLGANSTESKLFEIKEVFDNGADEIDFVINIGKLKQGKFDYIENELKRIRKASKGRVVKAIIETCYLTKNEIVKISKLCLRLKIDFIKTSTGFGCSGANLEDVKLIYETVKGGCKIKASGGIRSRLDAVNLLNCGAARIGTSHII